MPPFQKRAVSAQIPFPVPQLDAALSTPLCVNSPLSRSPMFSTFESRAHLPTSLLHPLYFLHCLLMNMVPHASGSCLGNPYPVSYPST